MKTAKSLEADADQLAGRKVCFCDRSPGAHWHEKIKECPFCGWAEPTPQFDAAAPDEDQALNSGYVRCLECGAFGPDADTMEGGIEKWNARAEVRS